VEDLEWDIWVPGGHARLEEPSHAVLEVQLSFLGAHGTGVKSELEPIEQFGQLG
jgi:hypothetical protein